jgi:hypothetical protein
MKKETVEWLYNWTKDKELVTVEELLTAFEKFKEPSNPTKQTAVEWLEKRITVGLTYEQDVLFEELFNQAKEMEKEQIIKAYNTSFLLRDKPYSTAEKYYNETFKQQEQ